MAADFVQSSHAKEAVAADPDQPVISASPASAQRVIPPVPFTAIGCAVRWLAERRRDPHNCQREHDKDRDDNFPPHAATIATAEGPIVTAVWQFRSFGCMSLRLFHAASIWAREAGAATRTYTRLRPGYRTRAREVDTGRCGRGLHLGAEGPKTIPGERKDLCPGGSLRQRSQQHSASCSLRAVGTRSGSSTTRSRLARARRRARWLWGR